ncbi:MAG: GNAT family N-acetyltransferase [Acidimicrobiales bacterium]|nr:GNAT family N-acetyltransferase [Acidimicrobiaceae bacterium]MYG62611.1 GNAT family N-acetyltransferase [Acidimicrobiales bacterium]MYJ47343.1 GNAT family N-acetyltransferase [Acidimicrobiales bacterium]
MTGDLAVPAPHNIAYRAMAASDVGSVPVGCMGEPGELDARIATLGSAAILAFDGDRHVGQLQFRQYIGGQRSPDSIWDPLYWMDFDDRAPSLPPGTISVFCYHVGQLDDTDDRDSRYFGQGIGAGLLDHLLEWAASTGVAAVVAKASPSLRPVMSFMGGQPVEVYEERGFQTVSSWSDPDLAAAVVERGIATAEQLPAAATVSCCVLNLPEIR